MTLTIQGGASFLWPRSMALVNTTVGMGDAAIIDASGERGAFVGRVWWADRGDVSKDLTAVHLLFGTATFDAASVLTVSVQDVSLSAGPPIQPDGTPDQSYVGSAGVGPTASAMNRFALSANRTVTFGDLLSVVAELTTFSGTNNVRLRGLSSAATLLRPLQCDTLLYSAAAWAAQTVQPVIVLEFTDGTFGTLLGAQGCVTYNTRAFNSGSTGSGGGLNAGDERGLEFTTDVEFRADAVFADLNVASGADFEIVVYAGTTAMTGGTITVDANAISAAASLRRSSFPFAQELTFSPGTTYRVMIRPTTANNVTLSTLTLADAAHRVLYHGVNASGNSRVDGGAFGTPSTTELPILGLEISAIHDGAGGSGGGLLTHPGMSGGLNA